MARLDFNVARCEAQFASGLQRSDAPSAAVVAEAIIRTVRQFGIGGCVSPMALGFGDRPEAARDRMRWVRQLVGEISAPPTARLAGHSGPPPAPFFPDAQPATSDARAEGRSNMGISRQLWVSEGTVQKQVRSIFISS